MVFCNIKQSVHTSKYWSSAGEETEDVSSLDACIIKLRTAVVYVLGLIK